MRMYAQNKSILLYFLFCLTSISVLCEVSPYLRFTNTGEIAQVEYAQKAINQCPIRFALRSEPADATILLSFNEQPSRLTDAVPRTDFFCDRSAGVVALSAGYAADVGDVEVFINRLIQQEFFIFGEPPNLHKLSSSVAKYITEGLYIEVNENGKTKPPLRRPLAVSTILAAKDNRMGTNRLFQIENTGRISERNICFLGRITPITMRKALKLYKDCVHQFVMESDGVSAAVDVDAADGQVQKEKEIAHFAATVDKLLQIIKGDASSTELQMHCILLDRFGRAHEMRDSVHASEVREWIHSVLTSVRS